MTILDPSHDHQAPHGRRSAFTRFMSSPIRVALLAAAAVLVVDAGGTDDGPGLCMFRRCTGGYCPGCGMTRSARHLTRGQVGGAWQDHPWLVLAALQIAVAALVAGFARWAGSKLDWNKILVPVSIVNVVLLVGIWLIRITDGSIPRFF